MENSYQSLAHERWDGKSHIVFVPKRRWQLYNQIGLSKGSDAGTCIAIPPKYAVAQVIGFLKGKGTIAIAQQFGGKERNFTGEHF